MPSKVSTGSIALQNMARNMVAPYRFKIITGVCKIKPPAAKRRIRIFLNCRMKFRNNRLETASEGKQAPLFIDCPWLYSNTINKK